MCSALANEHVATKTETGSAETERPLPWKNEVSTAPCSCHALMSRFFFPLFFFKEGKRKAVGQHRESDKEYCLKQDRKGEGGSWRRVERGGGVSERQNGGSCVFGVAQIKLSRWFP